MTARFLISLIFLSIFRLSSPLPAGTLMDAAEILSDSGYLSMSLTLQLVSNSVIPPSPSLTIFSPSDSAFSQFGQIPLLLLKFHLSPRYFTPRSLNSLPSGSKIPTLLANHSVIVTSSSSNDGNGDFSLNGVKISGSPVFDDGSLVIFGIDKFLNPDFEFLEPSQPPSGCSVKACGGYRSLNKPSGVLRSKGYSLMASFLDLQMIGFVNRPVLTIFAPVDEVIMGSLGNFSEYYSIFLRHAVPCKISWNDLVIFDDGAVLNTYLEGFQITIMKSGDIVMLNEVPVVLPDMYHDDQIVVHGLRGMIEGPERPQEPEIGSKKEATSILDDGEF